MVNNFNILFITNKYLTDLFTELRCLTNSVEWEIIELPYTKIIKNHNNLDAICINTDIIIVQSRAALGLHY